MDALHVTWVQVSEPVTVGGTKFGAVGVAYVCIDAAVQEVKTLWPC